MVVSPLKDLLTLADSGVWGNEDVKHGVSVLRSTNFRSDGWLSFENLSFRNIDLTKRAEKKLEAGDILLEKSGGGPKQPVGRVCLFRGDNRSHAFGNFLARLRPDRNLVDPEYLFYQLWQFHSFGLTTSYQKQTSGIRNLETKRYLALPIRVPALQEQRRIADLLSRAESIVRMRREAEQKAKEIIRAVFLDMFGDPETNPKAWPIKTVGDVTSYTRYGPRFPDRKYAETGARILRTTDMDTQGLVRWKDAPILPISLTEAERFSLRPGTIVITRTGATIGKIALFRGADEPCIAGAYLIELGTTDEVDPDYLLGLFLSRYGQRRLTAGSRAVAQPNLNAPTIRAIPLPIPPLKLQKSFGAHSAALRGLVDRQHKAIDIAGRSFQSLLAGVFGGNGKVDRGNA
jgi:type I restriction enzyme S subunit